MSAASRSFAKIRLLETRLADQRQLAIVQTVQLQSLRIAIDQQQFVACPPGYKRDLLAAAIVGAYDFNDKIRAAEIVGVAFLAIPPGRTTATSGQR